MTHEEQLLFGERLRNRRDTLGFTQENVAEKLNITPRFYQMIERGEKGVSLNRLILLSKVLEVSIDYLLLGDVSAPKNPLVEILAGLSPQQREDALKILQLYSNACKS